MCEFPPHHRQPRVILRRSWGSCEQELMRQWDQLRLELAGQSGEADPSPDLALVNPSHVKGKGRDPSSLMETLIDQAHSSLRNQSGPTDFP